MKATSKFSYQQALITGASSGIGYQLSLELSKLGVKLFLSGRDTNKLKQLQKQLPHTQVIEAELSKREQQQYLAELIKNEEIDLLINNAGFGSYGPLYTHPKEDALAEVEVNFNALIHLSLEQIKAAKKQNRPCTILNISSALAFAPSPGMTLYSTCKSAVKTFSELADFENKEFGIRVLCSCPGPVRTNFHQRASKDQYKESSSLSISTEEAVEQIVRQLIELKEVDPVGPLAYIAKALSLLIPKKLRFKLQYQKINSRVET